MGLIVDSSIFIGAERQHLSDRLLLEQLRRKFPREDLGLSAVTVAELTHGIHRAKDSEQGARRRLFVERLCNDLPVYAFTLEVARLVGRIQGEQAALGNVLPFPDLVIGATALMAGFDVLTANLRHFRRIPGLKVVEP